MAFLPITLGVKRSSDSDKITSDRNRAKTQSEKALKRDNHTCRFCGFHADRYQRTLPYAASGDNIPFVTVCTFCEQCLALDRAGLMGSGLLIWLPEIAQAELNHIARAIYVAKATKGPMADAATRALEALTARRAEAKKRLGSDDPLLLATVMHESLTDEENQQAAQKLEGIRLLPLDKYLVRGSKGDVNQFPQLVKYWTSSEGPFASMPVAEWDKMLTAASAVVGRA